MVSKLNNDLHVTQTRYGNIEEDAPDAWLRIDCPWCAGTQASRIAYTWNRDDSRPSVIWARCVNCFHGLVVNGSRLSPEPLPLSDIRGLEPDAEQAWSEVRNCLSVGATTAAVHMCRKILLHVAVEKGLPAKNDNDRAPAFAACVEHLQQRGYVTPPMAKWVEKIKDVGNEGAHELEAIASEKADLVATFTMQLLVLTYQMPHMLGDAEPLPDAKAGDDGSTE